MINQFQRHIFLVCTASGEKDGLNARHLMIIGGGGDAQENGLGEARDGGKTDKGSDEGEDFLRAQGLQADSYHSNYDSYKQRACQTLHRAFPSELASTDLR